MMWVKSGRVNSFLQILGENIDSYILFLLEDKLKCKFRARKNKQHSFFHFSLNINVFFLFSAVLQHSSCMNRFRSAQHDIKNI